MKKETGKIKMTAAMLLCAATVFFVGCGAEDSVSKGDETAGEEQIEQMPEKETEISAEGADVSSLEGEGVLDSADVENAVDSEEENVWKPQTLYEAQIRHYYSGLLSQVIAARQLPDLGKLADPVRGVKMSSNLFAVTDIDGDGSEELLICYLCGGMAGTFEVVYGYDPLDGELKQEFCRYPTLTYYDNGIIKVRLSHNHSYGTFWPFDLYRYEPESDSYMIVGSVYTWDKEIKKEWGEKPFPDELDTDRDGILYHIQKEGEEDSYEYEDFKYNQADFEEWYSGYTEGAKKISIEYQSMQYESFADFTPTYLKLLADEAGKERTDTASDLGLLILNEDHFLDAAQTLLMEKYGVEIEQPEPDFEEYTVGLVSGREVFSFTALDAGDLSYSGEKVGDVTIFGIYPGISVDDAWEKLKPYGFYASPYGEVENCLITGEGFGNVSIWFSAEDNVVTQISVMPFCAFAG